MLEKDSLFTTYFLLSVVFKPSKFTHSFIHSLTHSLTCSFVPSFIPPAVIGMKIS